MREQSESTLYIIMDKAVLLDPLTKSQWHMNHYYHLAHHFALVSLISFSILIQSVSSTCLSIFECLFNSNCALITSTLDSSNWMDFFVGDLFLQTVAWVTRPWIAVFSTANCRIARRRLGDEVLPRRPPLPVAWRTAAAPHNRNSSTPKTRTRAACRKRAIQRLNCQPQVS